ncbi:nicotinamide-nucleotide amidase [Methylonatrum kenyense]|uniref:nicotinamide-nucleotide amidase n=1 Tax=Methylonatrum kenyense TaxID=455253 RepID=UPI0020BF4F2E|nr:nicotinamide-nucleotide amidase [Methylonatrum kenyense]MCK8516460.1 nicotinamide-nucleotide amidase [Methylonatrum kenyense]
MSEDRLQRSSEQLGQLLQLRGLRVVTAESCTGGWIGKALTDIAGSSAWVEGGFISYSNQCKQSMLGVDPALLQHHGAVSESVVRAMAAGALQRTGADLSIAVSGVAGPAGGSAGKPVGLVWFAWARAAGEVRAESVRFSGDREAVRLEAAIFALRGLRGWLDVG